MESMEKSFAVVSFPKEDNLVEIIPFLWLCDDQTKCFWPSKSTPNIQRLLTRNLPIQDLSKFKKLDIKLLKCSSKSFLFYLFLITCIYLKCNKYFEYCELSHELPFQYDNCEKLLYCVVDCYSN
jgi:hypothetical protein